MKTANTTNPVEEQNQKKLPPTQPDNPTSKSTNKQKWLKIVEFIVVSVATWLNPDAGFLIFLLKFCFIILNWLQNQQQ